MTPWPEGLWSAAVLRGLDARAQHDIEAAGALERVEAGGSVFRPGDPADAFFVVETGVFTLRAKRRAEKEPSVVREVTAGETFGEEATLRIQATRSMEASCIHAGRIARIPAHIFRRAAERAGAGEVAARIERSLRRGAARDVLRTAAALEELPAREADLLLDAVEHLHLARGETLYREGDPADRAYVVAHGILQLQSEDEGRLHVRAYLTQGDLLQDGASPSALGGGADPEWRGERKPGPAGSRARHTLTAVASGPAWVLAVSRELLLGVAGRYPDLFERARRVRSEGQAKQDQIARASNTTQHLLRDLYRLDVARSLLVIDQDTCVRCGHCAWSCANVHADGVSRLVRRGDKLVTHVAGGGRSSLLVPNSCQHCENPACMIDCPTGAIGRDPRGEVFIRESLCIGCGNCAKACPWDNIQMAERPGGSVFGALFAERTEATPLGKLSSEIAVKCDLCSDLEGGPACVASCPVEAIARVHPDEALPDLNVVLGRVDSRATLFTALPHVRGAERARKEPANGARVFAAAGTTWPWVAGAVLTSLALAAAGGQAMDSRRATGAVAATLALVCAAYSVVKRWPSTRAHTKKKDLTRATRSRLRPWFIGHLVAGTVVVGAAFAHAGLRMPANLAGTLALAFWGTVGSGAVGALAYAFVPARLARIERGGGLPEDLAPRARELDDRAFGALSGRSDLVKVIFARILRPYMQAPLGSALLLLGGRSLHEEQTRLLARIDRAAGGRKSERLAGIDELVRVAVERRAVNAQKWLGRLLRAWMPLHVVMTAIVLVLLAIHVAVELVYR
jgi:Fe-S-cluster-containing dehydrogenase component/CRP-like cAMP-binding protein